jgi:predicted cupin superfamily sugar epimerase
MTAPDCDPETIKRLLGLEPHPTCGFVAETYRSPVRIPADALPGYEGSRPVGSALHFLVTHDANIRLHRIRSDQQYLHHVGGALDVLLLYPSGEAEVRVVGSDLLAGQRPMLFIPGGTFHVARLARDAAWALLSSTEWPGVEPPDVDQGDPDELATKFPSMADTIRLFTKPG